MVSSHSQILKDNYIKGLFDTKAFIVKSIDEEPFTLRRGSTSYLFLDHNRVASSPIAYKAFIDVIEHNIQEVYKSKPFILCNVDSKISAQMCGSLAYKMSVPQIIYKSSELTIKEKGIGKQLTGDLSWNYPVAIVDDVTKGGDGTAKNVADLVTSKFTNIKDIQIFVGFIRDPKETTYKTHHVVTRDELIEIMWDTLTEGQREAIIKEKELV